MANYQLAISNIAWLKDDDEAVYTAVTGKADWHNELPKPPFDYDLRSRHADILGGADGYLCTKQQELDDITRFMRDWRD